MTTELILSPSHIQSYPTTDGILSVISEKGPLQKSILAVTPQYVRNYGYFEFEHFVWTGDGTGYRAHARIELDAFWELTFGNPPVYATDPHSTVLRSPYHFEERFRLSEGVEGTEECGRRCYRAWALSFASDYIENGNHIVVTGSTVPVVFRQKKFDYTCHLYASRATATGFASEIFAVFEDIAGVIEVPGAGNFFTGPVIAHEYLSRFLRGRFTYYERCAREAPSPEYQAMKLNDLAK